MILPITHENMEARRWPVVTLVIIAICFVIHSFVAATERSQTRDLNALVSQALTYHAAHPYLKTRPPLDEIVGYRQLPLLAEKPRPEKAPDDEEALARQQQHFDELGLSVQKTIDAFPTRRFGYVPARGDVLGLVTHPFLHGGWLHLLFNLWFLWLCGCNMEDRWGRAVYGPFYVAAGIVAALAHKLLGGSPNVPLIGASGAIAGAMGAFLVTFAKTRIGFVTFVRLRPIFFTAPAFVMLPLWLALQITYLMLAPRNGVAYAAHVGGFVFGVVVAGALRLSGVEKKLDAAVEQSVTTMQDPRIVEASDLTTQGRAAEALALLDELHAEMPSSIDVQLEILRATKMLGQSAREMAAYARLMQLYVRAGEADGAIALFREVRTEKRLFELPAVTLMQMGQTLDGADFPRDATDAYEAVHRNNAETLLAVKAILAHAKIAARLGAIEEARALFTAARESPFSTKELDDAALVELEALDQREPAKSGRVPS
ncbi:rhomboid family intramembrane serine protease [Polyangium mundeleinium]|uniref:Rhomboid family intramembrane serine protease n=1 Tax=Polyangium mundeleinium TaxID=2995306 RepID=A0ABT5F6A3_9BACT|nr:rhomboid family intramembrane serine protease [Polyangium mundeleinium]MDC0748662.1 rhomboid family intramembrane serine protease [Polyangium mundeleinium]